MSDSKSPNKQFRDPEFIYNKMDETIRDSFNTDQKKEIMDMISDQIMRTSPKIVDIRSEFWFFKKFYFVLFFGRDFRNNKRPLHLPPFMKILSFVITMLFYGIELAAAALFFYIIIGGAIKDIRKP